MASTPDPSETIAEQYLKTLSNQVIFEPDGNIPPDFLVDGQIAVEVRGIHQLVPASDEAETLESITHLSTPLLNAIVKCLAGFGTNDGPTWGVCIDFKPPLQKFRKVKKAINEALTPIARMQSPTQTQIELQPCPGLTLKLVKAQQRPDVFVLYSISDARSGGWTVAETAISTSTAIEEKAAKVAPYQVKYQRWWLVLVNYVTLGLDAQDIPAFKSTLGSAHDPFEKVILLDPGGRCPPVVL